MPMASTTKALVCRMRTNRVLYRVDMCKVLKMIENKNNFKSHSHINPKSAAKLELVRTKNRFHEISL